MQILRKIPDTYLIVLFSILFFIPFLGNVHLFDWDEINFAECAREMIVSNDYLHVQIGFEPFYEKPPLFIWMQVLSMKLFGINEFAARFPNAICGLVTLLVIYQIGKKLHDKTQARWWVIAFACSILPHFYFKSGIIDPWFNLFIFTSYYFLHQYSNSKKNTQLVLAGLILGLSLLTKGPVAMIIILLCIGSLTILMSWQFFKTKKLNAFHLPISLPAIFVYGLLACLPMAIWYGIDIYHNGFKLVQDFLVYQIRLFKTEDAGHGGFPAYHVVVLLVGVFPASIFALQILFKKNETKNSFQQWMQVLFWVVLILFSLVQSKIVHYSSLCYFPITYLAALGISKILSKEFSLPKWVSILQFVLTLIFSLALIIVPFIAKQTEFMKDLFSKDSFALGNLNAQVGWTGLESIIGVLFACISFIGFYFYSKKKNIKRSIAIGFLASLFLIQSIIIVYVSRVEAYSQRAAIEFFESLQGKDVYVSTLGYKSYASNFYANVQPQNSLRTFKGDLFHDDLDKDFYFAIKNTSEAGLQGNDFIRLYEKNGYVFYKRMKKEPTPNPSLEGK